MLRPHVVKFEQSHEYKVTDSDQKDNSSISVTDISDLSLLIHKGNKTSKIMHYI
jgi:hypothetical protein